MFLPVNFWSPSLSKPFSDIDKQNQLKALHMINRMFIIISKLAIFHWSMAKSKFFLQISKGLKISLTPYVLEENLTLINVCFHKLEDGLLNTGCPILHQKSTPKWKMNNFSVLEHTLILLRKYYFNITFSINYYNNIWWTY